MGEIDRLNPMIRPVFGPPAAERVQPSSDQHRRHDPQEDKLDLTHEQEEQEEQEPEESNADDEPTPPSSEHGLDLSI